jgi:hypothetical protein
MLVMSRGLKVKIRENIDMNTDRFLIELIRKFAKEEMEFSDRDDLVSLCNLTLEDMSEENLSYTFEELSEYRWIYDAWVEYIQHLGLLKK